MATKKTLPSDAEFLLQYMDDMDSDCSDEDFDGILRTRAVKLVWTRQLTGYG